MIKPSSPLGAQWIEHLQQCVQNKQTGGKYQNKQAYQ